MAGAVVGWQHFMADRLSGLLMLASAVAIGMAVYAAIAWTAMPARIRRVLLFIRTGGAPAGRGSEAG